MKAEIATAFIGFNTNGSDIEVKQPINFHPYDDGKLEETRKHYSEGVVESAIQNKHFVVYFPHSKGRGQAVPKGCDNTKAGIRCRLHSQLPCKLETGEQIFHLGMFEYQVHTYGKTRGVDPHVEVFSLVSDQSCRLAL
ncbi:MAG: hypothetical protein NDI69_17650 [Bacteriovoracaceae bacterium]|nr:hypothetical protein [Bacteriovoracaceae bacterium]